MYQVVPCMLLVQVSWFLKHNNLVIRLYRVYDFDRKDDQGNLRDLHLEKSIDALTIGEPANSRPVTTKVDDLKSTLLVISLLFTNGKSQVRLILKRLLITVCLVCLMVKEALT